MFGVVGLFALVLVGISMFFPKEQRGQVIVYLLHGIGVASKWVLIGCGLYFAVWTAFY